MHLDSQMSYVLFHEAGLMETFRVPQREFITYFRALEANYGINVCKYMYMYTKCMLYHHTHNYVYVCVCVCVCNLTRDCPCARYAG